MTAPPTRYGRILVVDNDPDRLDSTQALLEARGYQVSSANTIPRAAELLTQERVHLALLDIRMQADSDHSDTSGLDFAAKIDPVVAKVIVTGYPSFEAAKGALGPVTGMPAVDVVTKQDGPAALLAAVERAFRERVCINFGLSVYWQGGLSLAQVAQEIELEDYSSAVVMAETEDILGKLFYTADEILVTPLVPPDRGRSTMGSGAVVITVHPRYRGSGWGAPMVVKLASRDKIIVEAGNYEQYVEHFIAGFRHTDLHRQVQTHLLGGIVYTLVGTPLEECVDLGTFYAQHSAGEVVKVLNGLFLETCRHWYANREARQVRDLVKLYAGPLKLSPERLEVALREAGLSDWIDANGAQQRIPGLEGSFVNPIQWLRQHPSLLTQVSLCYTHGDMHSRNVLVDRNRQAWMIDFYRTGSGHMLRDLIELESDVKFTLLEVTDLPSLVRFETALLNVKDYSGRPTLPRFQLPELQKAFFVVVGIRQIASRLADPGAHMVDYYRGLLLQTLAVIRMRHVTPSKKCHAYLAAALLCGWLEE